MSRGCEATLDISDVSRPCYATQDPQDAGDKDLMSHASGSNTAISDPAYLFS